MRMFVYRKKVRQKLSRSLRTKLGKIIQSFMKTDQTTSIVKYSEHAVNVQDQCVVLEDDALAKA